MLSYVGVRRGCAGHWLWWAGAGLLVAVSVLFAQPTRGQEAGAGLQAGSTATSFSVPRPRRLVPEETFVVSRSATITPAGETGAWIVTFANEPGQSELPPMFLMPARRLQRLESALMVNAKGADSASGARGMMINAVVSGQVFAYRGYNFLMLTAMPRAQVAKAAEAATPEVAVSATKGEAEDSNGGAGGVGGEGEGGGGEKAGTVASASADVEAMIKELEAGSPVAPILQRSGIASNVNQNANRPGQANVGSGDGPRGAGGNTLVEGAFVMNRAARLVRSSDSGAWAVVFESDDDGLADLPLIVLPCKLLERMEARVEQLGDAFRLMVSGQVYTYQGGVYLLPTLMQIPYRRDNLSP